LVELLRRAEFAKPVCDSYPIEVQAGQRQMHSGGERRLCGAKVGRHRCFGFAKHAIPLVEGARHRIEAGSHARSFVSVCAVEREAELADGLNKGRLGFRTLTDEGRRSGEQREQR
jgi:hypothetical protein